MSSLGLFKPRPKQAVENGHDSALREGRAFKFELGIPVLAPAAVADFRFLTGDLAVIFEGGVFVIDQEDVLFEVYEDTVYSNGGNPVAGSAYVINLNRLKPNASSMQFFELPTVQTPGTQVLHDRARGTAGQSTTKGGFGSGQNVNTSALKPNTEHLFRITNNSAADVDLETHIFYREVNPKMYT